MDIIVDVDFVNLVARKLAIISTKKKKGKTESCPISKRALTTIL